MTPEEKDAARVARKEARKKAFDAQRDIDKDAFDAAETSHGEGKVVCVEPTVWTPGEPTFAVVRMPNALEFKRWQDQTRVRDGKAPNPIPPSELLADSCVVYPAKDVWDAMCLSSPGLKVSAGTYARTLCFAAQVDEGKD